MHNSAAAMSKTLAAAVIYVFDFAFQPLLSVYGEDHAKFSMILRAT